MELQQINPLMNTEKQVEEVKLLPCPFCGVHPYEPREVINGGGYAEWNFVHPENHCILSKECFESTEGWNNRAPVSHSDKAEQEDLGKEHPVQAQEQGADHVDINQELLKCLNEWVIAWMEDDIDYSSENSEHDNSEAMGKLCSKSRQILDKASSKATPSNESKSMQEVVNDHGPIIPYISKLEAKISLLQKIHYQMDEECIRWNRKWNDEKRVNFKHEDQISELQKEVERLREILRNRIELTTYQSSKLAKAKKALEHYADRNNWETDGMLLHVYAQTMDGNYVAKKALESLSNDEQCNKVEKAISFKCPHCGQDHKDAHSSLYCQCRLSNAVSPPPASPVVKEPTAEEIANWMVNNHVRVLKNYMKRESYFVADAGCAESLWDTCDGKEMSEGKTPLEAIRSAMAADYKKGES